jgi:nucleotide-binding universal stress UspA family protein
VPEGEDAAHVQMTAYLAQTARSLEPTHVPVRTHLLAGHPASGILRLANDVEADLVVMSTHGRGGLQRLWLGSVALKVVQSARTPVLLVRAQDARKPRAAESGPRVAVTRRLEKEFVAGGHS